ncbi:MAG: NAD-dependent epimerase/dehydratase family protein [Chromatiales bacterium]|nr:NAD-dependent epimerase/dehydratase family protein [Chromatiales bacterium]
MTGATGFVGSAVARCLIEHGFPLRLMYRSGADLANIAGISAQRVVGDLCDTQSLRVALHGCDAVFHVAADYRLWVPRPHTIYRTNVEGSLALVRAAARAGVGRFIYTSSVATLYAGADDSVSDENQPVGLADMVGHYKRSKFLAEVAVRQEAERLGMELITVNPSTPVGPRDIKPTPTGKIIVDGASGRLPAYVDTGLNLAHVDDVAYGHLLAYWYGVAGRRYILGGDNFPLAHILAIVAEAAGRRAPTLRLPHAAVWPVAVAAEAWARISGAATEPLATLDGVRMSRKRMYFSSARAREELGYAPRPAGEGVHAAVRWFSDNGYLQK